MSFNWKAHAECLWHFNDGTPSCNDDRALMITEGERLQAELVRLERDHEIRSKHSNKLEAERDRLKEELTGMVGAYCNRVCDPDNSDDPSHHTKRCLRVREALAKKEGGE